MATEREIQETIARCVSIVVFFQNSQKTSKMKGMMAAEVKAIAGWLEEAGLCGVVIDEQILFPVGSELLIRYGPVIGRRLNAEFARAFKGSVAPVLMHATA